jgi:hypothetical protein
MKRSRFPDNIGTTRLRVCEPYGKYRTQRNAPVNSQLRAAIKVGGCKHNGSRTQVPTNSDYLSCALQTVH